MRMWQRLKILRTWNLHPSRGGNLNTNNFFAVSHLRHFWSRHPGHCLTIKGSIEHLPELLQVAPVFLSGTRLVWSLGVICLVMDYLDSSKTELQAHKKTRQAPEKSSTWVAGDCSEVKPWTNTSSKMRISNLKWYIGNWDICLSMWPSKSFWYPLSWEDHQNEDITTHNGTKAQQAW